MSSIDSVNKSGNTPAEFNNEHWVQAGVSLGLDCRALSSEISYCVIDDEMWVWNHVQETTLKLNPSATRIVFDCMSGKQLGNDDQRFADVELRGILNTDNGAEQIADVVNTEDSYYAFRFLRKLAMERHVPIFPALELTYLCNFDCIHCYRPQERPDLLGVERWKGLVSELKAKGSLGVVLTGGEPTAWPHLREFITYIRDMRMAFVLKTNGLLVDQELVDFLVEKKCHEVHISLYGADQDSNDYVTKHRGSFDRIIKAIRLCAEAGLKVRISSSLTQKTFFQYKRIIQIAEEYGVGLNIDPLLSPSASDKIDSQSIKITQEQVKYFCDGLGDALAPEFQTLRSPGSPVCSAARSNCSIAPTGMVYPCVGYWYETETLSVREAAFEDVWKKSPILNLVRGITNDKLPTCSTCKFREFCPRCIGAGYEETGEMYGISPNNCVVAEGVYDNYQTRSPSITSVGMSGSFGNRCS